jgi:hypothetical protein
MCKELIPVSILPNTATPHAVSISPSIGTDLTANLTDRLAAHVRSVPTSAWIAGAAALGVAAAAATASLWDRPKAKKRSIAKKSGAASRASRRKSAPAAHRRAVAA